MNLSRCLPAVLALAVGAGMTLGHTSLAASAGTAHARSIEPIAVAAVPSVHAASSPLIGVAAAGSRIVAVGQMGGILYSDDNGRTWLQAKVPVSVDLIAVQFPTPTTGWATGHDGVLLRSTDAGATWSVVLEGRGAAKILVDYYSAPERANEPRVAEALKESQAFAKEQGARPFLDLWFTDEKTGFVVGGWGLILRTEDAGRTWEPWIHRIDNPEFRHLNSIRSGTQSLWIAGESGVLWRLDMVARQFVKVDVPKGGSFFGIVATPGGIIAFGLLGRAIVSQDAGKTWDASTGLGSASLTGGSVMSDGRVVLVDGGAHAWISRDQGKTFSALHVAEPMSYTGVASTSAGSLALIGLGGVRHQALAP